jgi:hypothetical protein
VRFITATVGLFLGAMKLSKYLNTVSYCLSLSRVVRFQYCMQLGWEEVDRAEAREKVSHFFRNLRTKTTPISPDETPPAISDSPPTTRKRVSPSVSPTTTSTTRSPDHDYDDDHEIDTDSDAKHCRGGGGGDERSCYGPRKGNLPIVQLGTMCEDYNHTSCIAHL